MARGGIGVIIARGAPPPSKLGDDEEEGETPAEEHDEESDPKVGMMQEFLAEVGIHVDAAKAEAACEALERYLDSVGYKRDMSDEGEHEGY